LPAAVLIPWIALAYVIRGVGSYLLNTFLLEKRSAEFARVTWIGTISCMAGYALLIPHFKLWGAVTATLIGFSIIFVVALWRTERLRSFHYEYGRWLKIVLAAAIVLVPFELLRPRSVWLQIASATAAAVLFPLILVVLGFPNEQERRIVKRSWTTLAARVGLARRQPVSIG
jgi:O-antigen/teichoic acid export membrane protein